MSTAAPPRAISSCSGCRRSCRGRDGIQFGSIMTGLMLLLFFV